VRACQYSARVTRRPLALVVALLLVGCTSDPGVSARSAATITTQTETTPVESTPATAGDGIGDSLFPSLGNPGIDVMHYDVDISYDAVEDVVEGTVAIDLLLTEDRAQITLDSAGPAVSTVLVDGVLAVAEQDPPELRITLPRQGRAGDELQLTIAYSVATQPVDSPIGLESGWFNTAGGSYVLNEPDGARTWLPCNDHPSDKATFTFAIAVPAGVTAVANGALEDHRTAADSEVWVWQEDRPMATYLVQLLTGDYEVIESESREGLPLVSVVLRDDLATMQPFIDVTPTMIEFFEQYFGEYPLDRYGVAMTDSFGGLAMETQGRSLFSRDDFAEGSLGVSQQRYLSHELAHQWFGDAVSPARWQDIWLNESFATYGEWMWSDHIGIADLDATAMYELNYRSPGSSADPTADSLFGSNSYGGGAVVLHALRLTIGDDAFFELLTRWVAENNGESRTTEDFIALATDVAGKPLPQFFDEWLYAAMPPTEFPMSTA